MKEKSKSRGFVYKKRDPESLIKRQVQSQFDNEGFLKDGVKFSR